MLSGTFVGFGLRTMDLQHLYRSWFSLMPLVSSAHSLLYLRTEPMRAIYCSSSPRVTFCIFDSLLEIRCCLLKGTNAVFNWGHGKVDSMRTIKGADIFQELRYWFGRWDRFQGTSPSVAYIEWISSEHRPVGCTKETFSYRCSEVHLFQILQHISPHPLITSPIWCLSASIKNTTADEVMVTSYTRLQFTRLLSKILTYDGSPASMAASIM